MYCILRHFEIGIEKYVSVVQIAQLEILARISNRYRDAGTTALLMLRKQRHPAEGFTTPVTGVLLDVAVSLQMSPEIASVGERAVAMLTSERLLAGVRSDVTLKKPRPGERFATCMALARQGVRPDVHLQRPQTDVHLLTVFA